MKETKGSHEPMQAEIMMLFQIIHIEMVWNIHHTRNTMGQRPHHARLLIINFLGPIFVTVLYQWLPLRIFLVPVLCCQPLTVDTYSQLHMRSRSGILSSSLIGLVCRYESTLGISQQSECRFFLPFPPRSGCVLSKLLGFHTDQLLGSWPGLPLQTWRLETSFWMDLNERYRT